MKDREQEFQNLSNFLGGQIKILRDVMADKTLYEYASFYKASMNHVFRPDDLIGVDDNGHINLMADSATHKIIGLYGTIGCEEMEFVLLDLITNELFTLKL